MERTMRECSKNIMLFVGFLSLAILIHHFHELWHDEYIAYNIVARSHSLAEIYHRLAYEGHPMLWYAELYALLPLVGSPVVLDVASTINVAVALGLVIFLSPFSFIEKILILCGYYLLYEYSAISRSYTLVPPLLFGLCCLLRSRGAMRPGIFYLSWGVLNILLANVSLYSAVLLLPLSLVCARGQQKLAARVGVMAFAAVTVLCVVATILPPPGEFHTFDKLLFMPYAVSINALISLGRSQVLLTIPLHHIWKNYFASYIESAELIVFGALLVWFQIKILIRSKWAAASFILSILCVCGLMAIVSNFEQRHSGHLWLLWIALVWVDYDVLFRVHHKRKIIFYGLILLHAIAGIWMYAEDIIYSFSDNQEISKIITASAGQRYIFAAYPAWEGAAFVAYSTEENPQLIYGKFGDQMLLDDNFVNESELMKNESDAFFGEPYFVNTIKQLAQRRKKVIQTTINFDLPVLLREANRRCVPAFVIVNTPLDMEKSSAPLTEIFRTRHDTLSREDFYAYKLTTDNHCR